ncbi:hypothetical protein PSP6_390090 [Paraburkholderia tropica]|nr:hypothetical protein PSP6_390090 [Paraburkholderia tropica]
MTLCLRLHLPNREIDGTGPRNYRIEDSLYVRVNLLYNMQHFISRSFLPHCINLLFRRIGLPLKKLQGNTKI